jgi:hypothetical protein
MGRALVHIGAGKTGSTAIQYLLWHNRAQLAQLGFEYPVVAAATRRMDGANHNQLAYELVEPRPGPAEAAMTKALARSAAGSPVTLLSAEVLYMRPFESEFDGADAYLAAKNRAIDRMMALLAPFERVDILCYVRRHDRWLESLYNERMKTGRVGSVTFAEFAASYGWSHYRPQLDAWASRIASGQVTVRPYEQAVRCSGGLLADFARAAGIDTELQAVPASVRSANPGLGRDFVQFSRLARTLPLGRRAKARLSTGLMQISARQLATTPEPKSWSLFLSYEDRLALLEKFAADDAAVAEKYLSPDFDRLFEPPTREENADYPGLSAERAFEIAAELLEYDRALGSPVVRRMRKYLGPLIPRQEQP